MNVIAPLAAETTRKLLGQYFSGEKVGRLLAALCDAATASSIIDPMVGRGDLLSACLDVGAQPAQMLGIEIDPVAARSARKIKSATITIGNAFDPRIYAAFESSHFDLVIANPPYVRYQDLSESRSAQPSASEIRNGLIECLGLVGDLDQGERGRLLKAAKSYSGLSDLAVPSVILCMALVARGGALGLVLPQAWLSRNYSADVRACLDELFEVEMIVEDASATWFDDALVRTVLVIAHRRNGLSKSPERTQSIRIHSSAANEQSLVGALFPKARSPELKIARQLRSGRAFQEAHVEVSSLHPGASSPKHQISMLSKGLLGIELETALLKDLQVSVSQGLRTGANEFFYVFPVSETSFRASKALDGALVHCPSGVMRRAIRDQSGERHAVLDLRSFALPEDLNADGASTTRQTMGSELAAFVRKAGDTPSGKPGRLKPIKELSAVKTNVRRARGDQPARYWYMLPDFQRRHLPDCYLPRVIAKRPTATITDGETLVDANFITFVCEGELNPSGLSTLLNSSWVWLWLEHEGAVMGGGALKIEGTMLKRLPLPRLTPSQIQELNKFAERHSHKAEDCLVEIGVLSREQHLEITRVAEKRFAARIKK